MSFFDRFRGKKEHVNPVRTPEDLEVEIKRQEHLLQVYKEFGPHKTFEPTIVDDPKLLVDEIEKSGLGRLILDRTAYVVNLVRASQPKVGLINGLKATLGVLPEEAGLAKLEWNENKKQEMRLFGKFEAGIVPGKLLVIRSPIKDGWNVRIFSKSIYNKE